MKSFIKRVKTFVWVVLWVAWFLMLVASPAKASAQADQPVVRAVLFWSSTCGHCQYVITEVLPVLQNHYKDQLEIMMIELSTKEAVDMLYETASAYGIPKNSIGIPFLVVGERVLIGSQQIPEEFPGIIENYLAKGGIKYPSIDALAEVLPTPTIAVTPTFPAATCPPETPSCSGLRVAATAVPALSGPVDAPTDPVPAGGDSLAVQPDGFMLATLVLVGMAAALIYSSLYLGLGLRWKPVASASRSTYRWRSLGIVVLCLVGLGVAGYLAYIETQSAEAICGPVGDCNTVQSSPYARLFGVLPIGVLGVIGYLLILLAWVWGYTQSRTGHPVGFTSVVAFGMAVFGVLFSIYLTYLEPFVIKAVCMWCLSSAVIMTLLLILMLPSVRQALRGALQSGKQA